MTHFRKHGRVPRWFEGFGELGSPIPVPSWSRFQMVDEETNILITGVPDEILRHPKRGIWIGDYKIARFTQNQDELAPMYQVQLNCYGLIAEKIGLGPAYGLGLLYYEPDTDLKDPDDEALIKDDRFFLGFSPKLRPVTLEPDIIPPLLRRIRGIYNLSDTPPPQPDCRDCGMLDNVVRATVGASYFLKQDLIRSLAANAPSKRQLQPGLLDPCDPKPVAASPSTGNARDMLPAGRP